MSTEGLRSVSSRVRVDEAFCRQLNQFPDEVLQDYPLTDDEIWALQAGDADALTQLGLDPLHAIRTAACIRSWSPVANAVATGIAWEAASL